LEFQKVEKDEFSYWVWLDEDYLPYINPTEEDIKNAPKPLLLRDINPNSKIGFETQDPESYSNTITLKNSFEELDIDSDLRKDLKRIEKKNEQIKIIANEPDALEKSKHWFIQQWDEPLDELERRLFVWKSKVYTVSAYLNEELIAVHIALEDNDTIHYLGCWWNREYKNLSTPTFLLKKDIENAIKTGKKKYDLGVGLEPYKKKWGVIEIPMRYYAEMSTALAEKLEIKKFVAMQ